MTGEFNPDWVSPPFDTVVDVCKMKNIDLDKFREYLRLTPEMFDDYLRGERRISHDMARRLTLLGATANFWMNRDRQYFLRKQTLD